MKMTSETIMDKRGNLLFRVQLQLDEGRTEIKTLNYDSYIRLLMQSESEKKYFFIGKVPAGFVEGMLAKQDTFRVVLNAPAEKRLMLCEQGHYWIPFPGCLFFFDVEKGVLKEKSVFSYADTCITNTTKIYRYPFGNVSWNGYICFGNIHVSDITFSNADKIVDAFFAGRTNNDHYDKNKVTPHFSWSQLLNKLAGKRSFPNRWLVDTGKTYAILKEEKKIGGNMQ